MKITFFLILTFSFTVFAQVDSETRDPKAPLKNEADCLRGSDSDVTIGGMPKLAPNKHLQNICEIRFSEDLDHSLYFASSNVFVNFEIARSHHSSWVNYFKTQTAIKEETHDFAEATADREAIANCREYASANDRNPEDLARRF
jgi:hypothetical protein